MSDLLILCATTPEMNDQIALHFVPTHWHALSDQKVWLRENSKQVQFLLTDGHLGAPADILSSLQGLKAISSYGVGYDAIDTDATNARQIPVSHTPNVLDAEVSTTALMLYLAAWRNLEAEMANARTGDWGRGLRTPLSQTADARHVGIMGLGRIGKALARKLTALDCKVSYFGRSKQEVPYDYFADPVALAQACDTIISVLPGGEATEKLIGAEVIAALGPDGCFVNVGRGSVVDEAALIDALQSGRLGRAALDVFATEPQIPQSLRALPNVVLTPHIGSATQQTRAAMGKLAVDNLIAFKNSQKLLTPVPESAAIAG